MFVMEPGISLAHYRLIEKIGEGGMGQVWKARDTRLDREVAVKVLNAEISADKRRLARFEREAKLLASINHPNIATIYGLDEQDGRHFIAMELIPGEDLAHRLDRGPLGLGDVLRIARQIAAALEAHENTPDPELESIDAADAWARRFAGEHVRERMAV